MYVCGVCDYMCAYSHVCTCGYGRAGIHVKICGRPDVDLGGSSLIALHFIFKAASLIDSGAYSSRLDGQ